MSMFELICVTNRALCCEELPRRIAALCAAGIDKIILREKDLSETEYIALARSVLEAGDDRVILHHFPSACSHLHVSRLHLSLYQLQQHPEIRDKVSLLGVSVHSPEDARQAEALGADYVTAGHVFETDCKRGLPGRGLSFLQDTCRSVQIPVYAIGGISTDRLASVQDAGAAGACLMSGFMCCTDPQAEISALRSCLL